MAGRPNRDDPARLFVDSGAWLAFFSARDRLHPEADRLFRHAFSRKIQLLTSDLVLAEVHRLLLDRAGIRPAMAALDRIEAAKSVGVEIVFADADVHRAAREWLDRLADQVITYTDASSFALMRARRCESALSFDRDFELAGFRRWTG